MKIHVMASIAALSVLAACGGGGGSSGGNGGGGGGYTPPVQTFANTSNPHYLPFAAGNRWVMASGGILTDEGSGTLTCTCDWNGRAVEALDITTSAGAYSSTFIFAKNAPGGVFGSSLLTYIDGTSTNHGSTISLIVDGSGHTGIMVADDNPSNNEFMNSAGASSTIYPIGGVQAYQSTQIDQIATDTLTAPGLSLIWGFARGVGMTGLSIPGSGATVLTSFSINAGTSAGSAVIPASALQSAGMRVTGTQTPAQAAQLLRGLLE